MDVLTPEQRSRNMRNIKSKDTRIEIVLRKALWAKGYRYRKNYRKLPGSPDIALTRYQIAIFCDSEFFHGKNWDIKREKLRHSSNPDLWISKIERNMERDQENEKALQSMDWIVLRFWGNDILKQTDLCVQVVEEAILDRVLSFRE